MKPIQSLAAILFLLSSASYSFADTAQEIRDVVEANMVFTNKNLSQDPMRISSGGSKEFFSSCGLLNTLTRNGGNPDLEFFSGSVKHIEVVVFVE